MENAAKFEKVIEKAELLNLPSEAEKLLANRKEWTTVITSDRRQAVYFIRLKDRRKPIRRWLGDDDKGIINIGRTTDRFGIKSRSRAIITGTHQVATRLANAKNRIAWVNDQSPKLEYCYCAMADEDQPKLWAKFWEGILLLTYYRRFGETPPMNRRLEYIEGGSKKANAEWQAFLKKFEDLRRLEWALVQSKL